LEDELARFGVPARAIIANPAVMARDPLMLLRSFGGLRAMTIGGQQWQPARAAKIYFPQKFPQ
jgi:hypothetical protein